MEVPAQSANRHSRVWKRIAIPVFLAALLLLAVMNLPRGFDTDLGKIGTGRPALVFVYDPNLVVSNQQTRELDALRETLGDALHFLVADIGRPDAQQFMRQHQAGPTQLLLFAPDGSVLGRMQALLTAEQLLETIDAAGLSL
jgi:hypothetical protein